MTERAQAQKPGTLKMISRYIFSRSRMVFYEYPYSNPDPWQPSEDGPIFRVLTVSDLGRLSELLAIQRDCEPVFKPAGIQQAAARLETGEVCYICEKEGRIIGYSWFAKGEKYIPEIESTILLGQKDLYLFNSYILKDHRRRNVVGGNLSAARKDLIPQGFAREITATMEWNKPAGGSLMKLNFRVAGTVTAGYLLTFRYVINTCRDIVFRNQTGTFGFYRKMISKLRMLFFRDQRLLPGTEEDDRCIPG